MNFEKSKALSAGAIQQGSYLGLERVATLLAKLGDPQLKLRCIHIAGTNGKGSTAAMSANILFSAGYRTGMYISPAIFEFNDRISINGITVSDSELELLAQKVRAASDEMMMQGLQRPTEFEFVTAMAFVYFYEKKCDFVVLETGMGGRLDATNTIIKPEVSVITPIGMDHTRELGDTLALIAGEKAGIIKRGCPVVSAVQQPEAAEVIKEHCERKGCQLYISQPELVNGKTADLDGQTFDYGEMKDIRLSLNGAYQLENVAVVLKAVEVLRTAGLSISERAVRAGLESTVWKCRMQVLRRDPPIILDGSHNPHGVKALVSSLRGLFGDKKLIFVMGILADKAYDEMMSLIAPLAAAVITITPPNPRALCSKELAEGFAKYVSDVTAAQSIPDGLELALKKQAESGLPMCCCGSLYSAGSICEYFGGAK